MHDIVRIVVRRWRLHERRANVAGERIRRMERIVDVGLRRTVAYHGGFIVLLRVQVILRRRLLVSVPVGVSVPGRLFYKFRLHGFRRRWHGRFRLSKLVHRIPGLLFLYCGIGPGLQLAGAENRVKRHSEDVNARCYDENVSPTVRVLLLRDVVDEERNQEASDGADPVGHTHQDAGVSGRDVQMIDVEAGNGETAARDADREGDRSRGSVLGRRRVCHHQEEERFHTETAAIENLPDIRRRQDAAFTEMIRQQTAAWYNHRHQQVRKRPDDSSLDERHPKGLVHETRLKEHQQIEVPRSTEIGDDDGVYGHGGEKLSPRRRRQGGHGRLHLPLTERVLDVA